MKNLISCNQFTKENLQELFDLADQMKKNPENYTETLKGKLISVMFFEPSTRTRMSFEAAIERLGGKMIITENGKENSSARKGETIEDTIKILAGYTDAIIMRHSRDDSAEIAASVSKVPIINAGSGKSEHPTQSLLDMYTIKEKRGSFDGVKIGILGDLKYGRTIHSLIEVLSLYDNVEIYALSKEAFSLQEEYIEFMKEHNMKYKKCISFDDMPKDVDVLYHTRIQSERFEGDFGKEEFIINKQVLDTFSKDTIVMHPLPRNEEISTDIDDDERAKYFKQAENGMWVRMALLAKILTSK